MKLKGVVVALGIGVSLHASDVQPLEQSAKEMLEALFKGIEHLPVSYLQRFRFVDIESMLEDSGELEKQFNNLSDKQRQELIETVEQFNKAIAEELFSLSSLEDDNKA